MINQKCTVPILTALLMQFGFSQENARSSFSLQEFKILADNTAAGIAVVQFSARLEGSGKVSVELDLPEGVLTHYDTLRSDEGRIPEGSIIRKTWRFDLPSRDDYYLLEVALTFSSDNETDIDTLQFAPYVSFPLYFELKDGQITSFSLAPDQQLLQEPVEVDRTPGEEKLPAYPVPFDTTGSDGSDGAMSIAAPVSKSSGSYDILVQVFGTVKYAGNYKTKGVPAVAVWLDWDYDNNASTRYTPYYGGNTRHVDYDLTKMDGSYFFSFRFESPEPANSYSPRIRVTANNANEAAFDGDLGNGARMADSYVFDISGATTLVYASNADVSAERAQGGALRHIYRGREFSSNRLDHTPPRLGTT